MKSIGEIIREYRKKKGITQEALGRRLFVSKQAVSKWERDITMPDLDVLRRVSRELDIPSAVILQPVISDPRAYGECEQSLAVKEDHMKEKTQIESWRDFKFGMFIHYGVYSVIGRINEWVMFYEPIDMDDYADIAREQFTAENFDAGYYARLAKKTGMKYMVMTAKHHDGFSLFDSKHSYRDFTVMNTPAKRDLIAEYTEACRAEGLGVGIYYSPMDWRFEGYFFPQMYRRSAYAMRQQCHEQVKELVENYGKIDVLWFDGGEDNYFAHGVNLNKWAPSRENEEENYGKNPPYPEFWGEQEIHETVRSRQPHIVVNNRLGGRRLGDYTTPERIVGAFDTEHPWETCDTLLETWGWVPGKSIKSLREIICLLVDVVTGGGNLLFNVSPRGDGSLDPTHEARLLEVGEWMDKYGDTVYGTRGGPFKNCKESGGFTYKGDTVNAFIKEEAAPTLRIPLCGASVHEVVCRTGEEVEYRVDGSTLCIKLRGERAPIMSIVQIRLSDDVSEIYKDTDPVSVDAFK